MVNENNKYIPKVPETFTVAYLETGQEIKKSPLSAAARSKVINRSGGNYRSLRATMINPGYGPVDEDYLVCGCPAKGCDNEDLITWFHAEDDKQVKITKWAYIKCSGSNCSANSHMRNWLFECPKHKNDFKETSSLEFWKALFIAADDRAMDDNLLDELTKYLKKPENKW